MKKIALAALFIVVPLVLDSCRLLIPQPEPTPAALVAGHAEAAAAMMK
jgi:hypothetical protein